ncbi:MAG: cytochrome b/b6 domain-containing protein [Erythrobacter sp.]|nr:cytochrome b/b6 domain-containing protein [Erythrobacter sp.]
MSESAKQAPSPKRTVDVWDLPVRLCHWAFALLVPAMWWTAENSEWGWHKRLGLLLLGLLLFRIVWGVVGSPTARFASFVRGPAAILAYLRSGSNGAIGHNPLGAVSVVVLLLAMLVQVSLGLFAGDPFDGATGPLNPLVGVLTADMLTDWHETFFDAIVVLIGLHLAAIAYYAAIKRNNLIGPMIGGKRTVESDVVGNAPAMWKAVLLSMAIAAGATAWIAVGAPPLG